MLFVPASRRPCWESSATTTSSRTPSVSPNAIAIARRLGPPATGGATAGSRSARGGAAVSDRGLTPRLSAAAQTEDGQEERGEEDLQADDDQGRREHGQALLRQLPEAALDPGDDDAADDHEAGEQRESAGQQPVLEPEARAHAVEPRVPLAHEVRAVGMGAQAHRDDLDADDH